jgi:hypothetical protein
MPAGSFSPEISVAFTVAPEVVYSPIVPAPLFATYVAKVQEGLAIAPKTFASVFHST